MKIINTFNDLSDLQQLIPVCMHCEHMGFALNDLQIRHTHGDKTLIVDYKTKLKCIKCGSKNVQLILRQNAEMPEYHQAKEVYYSDDLYGGSQIALEDQLIRYYGEVA